MEERAIYIEETGLWYKQGASPLEVRVISKGQKLEPLLSVKADSYPEAFEALYGHAPTVPAPVRAPRREVLA
jgi:hypothetical protein